MASPGDGPEGHDEPKAVTAVCAQYSALVSWDAVIDDHLSGYNVYKQAEGESQYTLVNQEPVTATQYLVTGLSSGVLYSFGVVSVFQDGHVSIMSVPASCTTG